MITEILTAQRHFRTHTGQEARKIGLTADGLIALRHEIFELYGGIFKPNLAGKQKEVLGLEIIITDKPPIACQPLSFYLQLF